jgi:dienelactone hydrolase
MESKGYHVECPNTSNTADGKACIATIEKMRKAGIKKIGISGHSQGGGASFVCAQLAEQRWGGEYPVVGVEPAHGFKLNGANITTIYPQIKSPTFQWYGTRDDLVRKSWVWRGYQLLESEKYWLGAVGAPHVPIPYTWINDSVTFFDWKLKGTDGKEFKNLANTPRWENP